MQLKIPITPEFTAIVTGHGLTKSYLLYTQGQILYIFIPRNVNFTMLHHLRNVPATLADVTFNAFPSLTGLNQSPLCMNGREFTSVASCPTLACEQLCSSSSRAEPRRVQRVKDTSCATQVLEQGVHKKLCQRGNH
jgi:hypothetical protein